ncbi:O-succinylbenzoic acid--CoA ligase [Actinomycetales bacterium JB111]|nr:O-succinylbenzoic acid--CoA ligase [Actinomycetales bacterium JB111]
MTGGSHPDDVARLAAALASRLAPWIDEGPAGAAGDEPGDPDRGTTTDDSTVGTPDGAADDAAPIVPVAPGTDTEAALADLAAEIAAPVPAGTAVLLRTSGSTTGRGHVVALGARALIASARATLEHLGGPGTWVLAVPAHHVAGLQILTRSIVGGTTPVVVDTSGGFTPEALADGIEKAAEAGLPVYVSLVPTQLVRILAAGPRELAALKSASAVLVGGAALATDVREAAANAGIRVVRTYGMTETGGGCVYDGRPLRGVRVDLEPDGRVLLGGPVLASGYLDDPELSAATFTGGRLRTTDLGRLSPDGTLTVLGRIDDALTTGGVTIAPAAVEAQLAGVAGIAESVVVGVPDAQWGEMVVAVVTAPGAAGDPDALPRDAGPRDAEQSAAGLLAAAREACRPLSAAHAPRAVVVVDRLPLRGPGKVDWRGAAALAARALGAPSGEASTDVGQDGEPRVRDAARHGDAPLPPLR